MLDHVQFRLLFNAGRLRFFDHRDLHPFGRLLRSIRQHEYRYSFDPFQFVNAGYTAERAAFDLNLFRIVLRSEIPWKIGRRPALSYDWTAAFPDGDEIEMALRRETDELPRPGRGKRVQLPISNSEALSLIEEAERWARESARLSAFLVMLRKNAHRVITPQHPIHQLGPLLQAVKFKVWGKVSLDGFDPVDNNEAMTMIVRNTQDFDILWREQQQIADNSNSHHFTESFAKAMVRGCWRDRIPIYPSRYEVWGDVGDARGFVVMDHSAARDLPRRCVDLIAGYGVDVIHRDGYPMRWGSEALPDEGLLFSLTPQSTWTEAQLQEAEGGYAWYRRRHRQIRFSGL